MILYTQKFYCKEKENELKKFSQQDRLSKLGTDAEFLAAVEVGQYFMTRDTEEFSQMTDSVACRENTMPRDAEASEPKGWIRENTKIGPVLEVTTCCLQGKYGVESIVKSVKSQSWVRISHGLKKLVTNVNNKDQDDNEQETSEMQFEEYALKLNASDFASRSKAKANPQRRDSASSPTRTIPIGERTWTDAEPQKYSLSDYPVSKKLINLLRHGSLPRDNDGAIEFWRIKGYLQDHLVFCQTNDDEKWKSTEWQEEEDTRKYFSIVLILQEQFSTSELSKVIQDAILLIFHYRTVSWFRTVSSSTFITSDVRSIYIP